MFLSSENAEIIDSPAKELAGSSTAPESPSCSRKSRQAAVKMRKIAAAFMCAVLSVALAGCSSGGTPKVSDRPHLKNIVQINKATCDEAGSGTEGSLAGDIGDTETNALKAYSVFKELGLSDENIAGALGNWDSESSGFDPTGVETIFSEPFQMGPKKTAAMKDPNSFTLNEVFPSYAKNGTKINKDAYKGDDGIYYPGIGLAGFTGPAATRLFNYAKDHSMEWYTFDLQLLYAIDKNGYGRRDFLDNWAPEADATSAATTFLHKYEGNTKHLSKRQERARAWFEQIKAMSPDTAYAKQVVAMSNGQGGSLPKTNGTASSAVASSGEVQGDDNPQKVWNFLKSQGLSDEAAAGVMGNLQQESGMDPEKRQHGGGPAAGICQWEKFGDDGSRWGRMAAYAKSKGKDWTDLACQLEFMMQELPGCLDTYSPLNCSKSYNFDDFKKISNVDEAVEVFEKCFERAGKPNMENRKAQAREFYERFKGTAGTNQSEASEACEEDGDQKFGSSGITNGDEYAQIQGQHYHNGEHDTSKGTDYGAQNAACGGTSFTVGVNMLLGEKHKFCGVEVWKEMGGEDTEPGTTIIGWESGKDQAASWLRSKKLDSQIQVTGINDIKSRDDLLKKLQEGNVCVVSSCNASVFKNKDGSSRFSRGHYVLFYKYENGKFYVNDCGSSKAGGGVEYSESDVDAFFGAPGRSGGSCSIKRV